MSLAIFWASMTEQSASQKRGKRVSIGAPNVPINTVAYQIFILSSYIITVEILITRKEVPGVIQPILIPDGSSVHVVRILAIHSECIEIYFKHRRQMLITTGL